MLHFLSVRALFVHGDFALYSQILCERNIKTASNGDVIQCGLVEKRMLKTFLSELIVFLTQFM